MRRLPRYIELFRNRLERRLAVFQRIELKNQFSSRLIKFIEQRLGKEARRLAKRKGNLHPRPLRHHFLESPELLFRVVSVERLSKRRNHGGMMLTQLPTLSS